VLVRQPAVNSAEMTPTLPKGLQPGAEVFGLFFQRTAWQPKLLGRVTQVTAIGYEVHGPHGRLLGFQETPLFASLGEAEAWARVNAPSMPRSPMTFGNVR
jgi:hypothetical protein